MKYLYILFLLLPILSSGQQPKLVGSGHGNHNDTLLFNAFEGINYDTSYYDIDIDYPSRLTKFENSKRFKADSALIRNLEKRMFENYVDSNEKLLLKANGSYKLTKSDVALMKSDFKVKYSDYDRRYFGYIDATGEKNIIIKFTPKETIDFSKMPALPNLSFRTAATLNYNISKDQLWFANY